MSSQETMISTATVQEEANAATRDALTFVENNKVAVVDLTTLARATEVRNAILAKQKGIAAQLAKPKSWAHGLHAWFCTLEKAALAPYAALDRYEADEIRTFNAAETIRRQERERVIAEARHQADQARATAEAAALERAGEHAMAAAVVEEAIQAPPPVVVLANEVKPIQKFNRTWHFEVTDPAEVPRDFCVIDTAKLGRYATNMKDTARVPGVRFYFTDDPRRG